MSSYKKLVDLESEATVTLMAKSLNRFKDSNHVSHSIAQPIQGLFFC